MKKNIMMRLSALLLVAVLLTTCVISGTFAKYTDSETTNQKASVAKWGVEITATEGQDNEYEGTTIAEIETAVTASTTISSTTYDKVLAPGCAIDFGSVTVTGAPEVAVEVEYTATLTLTNWTADSAEYCPLVFVIGTDEFHIGEGNISDVADLVAAVEEAIENKTAQYAANTELNGKNDLYVYCYWNFEHVTDGPTQSNEKDTQLADSGATIELTITCTVTQLDTYPNA